MVALGGMVAPSFRSEKKTSAPGADGVGPPVGLSWAKAMPHAAALTISNVIAGLTNLDDLPASARHTSILVLHCEPGMDCQYTGVSGARANCASAPMLSLRWERAAGSAAKGANFARNAAIRRRRRRTGSS